MNITIKEQEHYMYMLSRIALAIVYIWFGALKLIGESPANPLVSDLLERTLPFLTFDQFIIFLGIFEVAIGALFLLPRAQAFAVGLVIPHIVMTTGPLLLLPQIAWSSPLVPTLEGQYIIKNVLIVALAAVIYVENRKLGRHKR